MLNCDKWRPCFKANKHCLNHIMLDHMIWKGINVWPNKQNQAGSAREIACELTILIQAHKNNFAFSHSVPSRFISEYACMPDVLIHHIVHMEYFGDTLPILQNFEETIFINKLNGTLFRFSAFKSFLKFDCIQEALLHRGTTSLIGFITLWNYMEFIDMVTNSTGRIQREVLTTLLILSSWIKKFLGQQSNIWDDSSVEKLFR